MQTTETKPKDDDAASAPGTPTASAGDRAARVSTDSEASSSSKITAEEGSPGSAAPGVANAAVPLLAQSLAEGSLTSASTLELAGAAKEAGEPGSCGLSASAPAADSTPLDTGKKPAAQFQAMKMDLVLQPDNPIACLPPALSVLKAAINARKAKAAARALQPATCCAGQQCAAAAIAILRVPEPLAVRPVAQETVVRPLGSASEPRDASANQGAPKPLAPGPDALEIALRPPGSPSEPCDTPTNHESPKLDALRVDVPAFAPNTVRPAPGATAASKLRACAPAFHPRAPQVASPAVTPQHAAALLDERAKWASGGQEGDNMSPVPPVRHAPLPPRPPPRPLLQGSCQVQGPMRGPQRPAMRRNNNAPASMAPSLAGRVCQGPMQARANQSGRSCLPPKPSPSQIKADSNLRQPQQPLLRFG